MVTLVSERFINWKSCFLGKFFLQLSQTVNDFYRCGHDHKHRFILNFCIYFKGDEWCIFCLCPKKLFWFFLFTRLSCTFEKSVIGSELLIVGVAYSLCAPYASDWPCVQFYTCGQWIYCQHTCTCISLLSQHTIIELILLSSFPLFISLIHYAAIWLKQHTVYLLHSFFLFSSFMFSKFLWKVNIGEKWLCNDECSSVYPADHVKNVNVGFFSQTIFEVFQTLHGCYMHRRDHAQHAFHDFDVYNCIYARNLCFQCAAKQ